MDSITTTPQQLRVTIAEHGVAIVPNVLTNDECVKLQTQMWDYVEYVTSDWDTPVKRNDVSTWRAFYELGSLHGMMLHYGEVGHSQACWDVRQNPNVVEVFRVFYGVEALLSSFDGLNFSLPPEVTNRGWDNSDLLHTDQAFTVPGFKCMQAWVTALDVTPGDATLVYLKGSHKYHAEFAQVFGLTKHKPDWFKLNREQQNWFIAKGCELTRIECPAGSMVCWDSRTVHGPGGPVKGRAVLNFRMVSYVCMQPHQMATEKMLKRKREAFEEKRTTSHWAAKVKVFPKMPRSYGKPMKTQKALPAPVVTPLGRELAGF